MNNPNNNFYQFMQSPIAAQFMRNPMAMLMQKYNIPQDMNDPNKILQHLIDTNQVTQEQVNSIMQMKNQFMK